MTMDGISRIMKLGQKVLKGGQLTKEEALELTEVKEEDLSFLLAMAGRIRRKFTGDSVDLCAIVNGRSGMCSENCAYCAQSAYHQSGVAVYPLLPEAELVAAAKAAEAGGARRFSIVTSGRGMEADQEFFRIIHALARIKAETKLRLCASLGSLSEENARALKAAGVDRYHHNVETSSAYYRSICSTHTYADRVSTIHVALAAGLEVCSGGIIGMGESLTDRVDMAFELRQLGIHAVPINILNPVKGTRLENQAPLAPREILRTFALFRFILPACGIRTAGGRELNLRDLQAVALMSGIDGMIIGGYLTTGGRNMGDDLRMVQDMGLSLAGGHE